jgi:ADP-ribosyltransferase exoenzyme
MKVTSHNVEKYLTFNRDMLDIKHTYPLLKKMVHYIVGLTGEQKKILEQYKGSFYTTYNIFLLLNRLPKRIPVYNLYDMGIIPSTVTKERVPVYLSLPDHIHQFHQLYADQVYKDIQTMDSIFTSLPVTLPDMTLFRGMAIPYEDDMIIEEDDKITLSNLKQTLQQIEKKKTVSFPNYQSSSMIPDIAKRFSRVYNKKTVQIFFMLKIHKKHKIPGIFLPWRIDGTENDILKKMKESTYEEMEILLPRNVEWKPIGVKKTNTIFHPTLKETPNESSYSYIIELESATEYTHQPFSAPQNTTKHSYYMNVQTE